MNTNPMSISDMSWTLFESVFGSDFFFGGGDPEGVVSACLIDYNVTVQRDDVVSLFGVLASFLENPEYMIDSFEYDLELLYKEPNVKKAMANLMANAVIVLERYDSSGNKLSVGGYKNGLKHGRWTIYNGDIVGETCNYKDGLLDGLSRTWDEFGLHSERTFKAGEPDGIWASWDADGELMNLEFYENGDGLDLPRS